MFVRDLVAGVNTLISMNTNGTAGDGFSTDPAISGDGRYAVLFASSAGDLVPGDNNKDQDVFLRDLQLGTTTLVSVSTNGVDPGNNDSFSPVISSDGWSVLFHSRASNLAPGITSSGFENLFFRNLETAITYTLTSAGVYGASMTPDGHRVAFIDTAPGTSGTALYVWNSQTAAFIFTNAVSLYPSSVFPMVSISPDGQKVAFVAGSPLTLSVADLSANTVTTLNTNGTFASHAGLQFSAADRFLIYAAQIPPNGTQNVYRYDLQSGTNQLISQDFDFSGAANGDSDSPVISGDGHLVAFRSSAGDIVPDDPNTVPDLFIYDVSNNATILVSVNTSGSSTANDRSLNPVFSADGRTLLFQSWASDLSTNDFNNGCDVYAIDLAALPIVTSGSGSSTNSGSVFFAQYLPAGSFAPNPTISWPLASGDTYHVQYKNDLSDPAWQDLPANITFIGDTGYISDPSPPSDKRFYRVLVNR